MLKKISLIGVLLVRAAAALAQEISHDDLMNLSFALGDQMGKAYQMQINCGLSSRIGPAEAAGLFVNYMTEAQVQSVIDEYAKGMKRAEGELCDREATGRTLKALITSLSNYIRLAQPHMKPY